MKITDPSYTILHELDRQSLPVRIEYSGRICYKSEDRIDKDSAIPFVRRMSEYGHNSVLEMGVATFRVKGTSQKQQDELFRCLPRYLQIDQETEQSLLITGSIRAFRELAQTAADTPVIQAVIAFLASRHPYFFETIALPEPSGAAASLSVDKLNLAAVDQLSEPLLSRHRYLGVRFVVNRAVSHELVRHRPCAFLQESQRYCRYSADKFGNEVTFVKPLFFSEGSTEMSQWQQAMEQSEQIYLQLLETTTPQAARTVLPNSCKTEIIVYTNLQEWRHILALRTPKNADPSMREVMIPLQEELEQTFPAVFS
ncbi:FAD-dependent thymidylate synthase [Desulfogranum mediterraneum]|uniref:FAD-dependent thymidylate synthase n=1 Tax=Desulfogranum mediterraneum TaxID=160661 RepID=UPI0003FB4C3A|nr:FAD-dependent thymidylate synthase [Desulfogranum mediterraneum]